MRSICYNNKDKLMAGLICGGWDPYDGGQVYEIPLGGTIMKQKFALGGSGSTYIYGLVDATYKENMSKDECKIFVKNGNMIFILIKIFNFIIIILIAIAHAMARDGSSGGVIRLVIIDKDGVQKECLYGDNLPYNPNALV